MNGQHSLQGRSAIVTGGGSGIGRVVAVALAGEGAQVAVIGRRAEPLAETVALIRAGGGNGLAIPADVRDLAQLRAAVAHVAEEFGRVDILVGSAGLVRPAAAFDVTEDDWDTVMDTNLKGAFFLAQAAARVMAAESSGRIVNISSQFAVVGFPERVTYCSSKGGLAQMTRALAVEWAPLGITVNAVAPTYVETDLTRAYVGHGSFREQVLARIPVGRLARPDEIAAAVLYLVSPVAAMVTGTTLMVDGGWVAQ